MLDLVNCTLGEAQALLETTIAKLRQPIGGSIAVREGIDDWIDRWQCYVWVDRRAAEVLVGTVARFVRQPRENGKSPHSLSGEVPI